MRKSDLKTRSILQNQAQSKVQVYRDLVIGRRGWWPLIKFELVMLLCAWVPGALGLYLRSKLYPLVLGAVGRNVTFGQNVTLRHPHKIRLGDNVIIDANCLLDAKGINNQGITIGSNVFIGRGSILSCKDGDIILGSGCNIGFNCQIFSGAKVTLHDHVLVAAMTYIIGGGGYNMDLNAPPFAAQTATTAQGITIHSGVWLGAGTRVLDGVTIGPRCVIGAGAVVDGDVPAEVTAAGVPARVIRSRRAESDTP